MHGEYKMPGGKLVRVEFEVVDDHLTEVVVSGDFFLYPEEALEGITASLQGFPATSDENAIAANISAAIPADVEWLGSSPEALAIAVCRALTPELEEN